MRRFVITEKYEPWLWNDDVVLYQDKDFILVKALFSPSSLISIRRGFLQFDKEVFEGCPEEYLYYLAQLNQLAYLSVRKNRHIFAEYVPSEKTDEHHIKKLREKFLKIRKAINPEAIEEFKITKNLQKQAL